MCGSKGIWVQPNHLCPTGDTRQAGASAFDFAITAAPDSQLRNLFQQRLLEQINGNRCVCSSGGWARALLSVTTHTDDPQAVGCDGHKEHLQIRDGGSPSCAAIYAVLGNRRN